MKQSSIDVWEIRALQGIFRQLADRAEAKIPYTRQTASCLNSYLGQLTRLVELVNENLGDDSDPLSDMDRMDKWFVYGFNNLMLYLDERMKAEPQMNEKWKKELLLVSCRLNAHFEDKSDESSPA